MRPHVCKPHSQGQAGPARPARRPPARPPPGGRRGGWPPHARWLPGPRPTQAGTPAGQQARGASCWGQSRCPQRRQPRASRPRGRPPPPVSSAGRAPRVGAAGPGWVCAPAATSRDGDGDSTACDAPCVAESRAAPGDLRGAFRSRRRLTRAHVRGGRWRRPGAAGQAERRAAWGHCPAPQRPPGTLPRARRPTQRVRAAPTPRWAQTSQPREATARRQAPRVPRLRAARLPTHPRTWPFSRSEVRGPKRWLRTASGAQSRELGAGAGGARGGAPSWALATPQEEAGL